jgi:hypothetical protein
MASKNKINEKKEKRNTGSTAQEFYDRKKLIKIIRLADVISNGIMPYGLKDSRARMLQTRLSLC